MTEQTLPPPPGANAAYVSNTLPGTWAPDERRVVTVTMNNNGTTDWTTTSPTYVLSTLVGSGTWSWNTTAVSANVAQGADHTFSFVATAPSAGVITPVNFTARMKTMTTDRFGATAGPFVQVIDPAATPAWGCTLSNDDIPTNLTPGEKRLVNLEFTNSGTETWPATGMYVDSQDSPGSLWVASRNAFPAGAVPPGGTVTVSFTITAPSTTGTYAFTRELANLNPGSVGLFRTRAPFCVSRSIVVGGSPLLDAQFVNDSPFPTTMVADDVAAVNVRMLNTGTETWATGGNYALYSQNTPTSLWNTTSSPVIVDTANGQEATMTLYLRAPSAPGSYVHRWRMRKFSGASAGLFGEAINIPVTVTAMGTPSYGSTVASQTVPLLMTAGTNQTFSITMQNSGSAPWSGSAFQLYSTNTPAALWNVTTSSLGSAETVSAGASRLFNLGVRAPATAGTYSSTWRMRQNGGVGLFGATALTANIVVTLCGNNVLNGGEECDDANLVDNDGCSSACQWEQGEFALDSETPSRGLRGVNNSGQLAAVTIGDITGDGEPEVMVSQRQPPPGISRSTAGTVYGFAGGAGFFTDSVTPLPETPDVSSFRIVGASVNDSLGLVAGGRFLTGEVTGDSIDDLIVSAPQADGAGDLRTDSGEVYVITGDPALLTAGTIDLGAMMMPTHVTAHIFGAAAGDRLVVLATGDLTGDGTGDLLLGAPGTTTSAGALYVLTGPVVGDIDLSASPVGVYTILGNAAGDQLGNSAATIGDFGGTADLDILVGVPKAAPGGLTSQGAAYGFFGPILANTTAAAADVTWIGAVANVNLGTSIAVGNVTGTGANEAIIGATQIKNGGTQFGGAVIWSGVVAGTYDMSAGAVPTTVIYGRDIKDNCGSSLALGQLVVDAYEDLVIGCGVADGPTNAGDRVGEIHVVLGAAALPAVYDLATRPSRFVIYGAASPDRLANYRQSLAVGDIDGDGREDICGGSYFAGGSGPPQEPGAIDCVATTF